MASQLPDSKPCPWCGKFPWLVPYGIMPKEEKGWQVGCEYSKCPVNPTADATTSKEAIIKWNKRIM